MLPKIDQSQIYIINLLRGTSAMLVLANHLRSAIFVPFSELEIKTGHVFYFLTSLGHQSVIIFFVISGYLVGGGILSKGYEFNIREYIISRFVRLYVVLLPALVITYILDQSTNYLNMQILTGEYFQIFHSGSSVPIDGSIFTIAINLLFLQDILGPVYGSNTPLWSLAYEFQYYLMFPALLIIFGNGQRSPNFRILMIILLTLMLYIYPFNIFIYFPIWIIGAISSRVAPHQIKIGMAIVSAILFVFALIIPKIPQLSLSSVTNDYILAGAVSLLIYTFKEIRIKFMHRQVIFLTEISYTTYLIHFPIVLFIAAIMNYNGDSSPGVDSYVNYFCWLVLILIICTTLWWLFERNTNFCRQYIRAKISKS